MYHMNFLILMLSIYVLVAKIPSQGKSDSVLLCLVPSVGEKLN
jgi:hypothetical protein